MPKRKIKTETVKFVAPSDGLYLVKVDQIDKSYTYADKKKGEKYTLKTRYITQTGS